MTNPSENNGPESDGASGDDAGRRIAELEQQLDEARNTIDALLSGEIDTVATGGGEDDGGAQLLLQKAQSELRASERRLRTVLENLPVAVWVADSEGKRDLHNPAAVSIWGELESVDDVPAQKGRWADTGEALEEKDWPLIRALRHGETVREAAILMEKAPDAGGDAGDTGDEETAVGNQRVTLQSAAPIADDEGRIVGAVGVAQDVTESRKLQERLQQKQKMEAVGELAGGVAHEFNNLLTAMLGHAELLAQTLDPDDPAQQDLTTIKKSGKRAADLTRQLLAYGRKQIFEPQALDPNEVVRRVEPMLAKTLGEHIEIEVELGEASADVWADPGQLEQVLLALALNARDAMPEGGRLTLRTRDLPGDETRGRRREDRGPGFVALEVADSGVGMDENTQKRIFDPFFSTKETGKGTGLGLSTVQGVMDQTGGHVRVQSAPGQGTTFTLLLPMVPESEASPDAESAPAKGGGETILVTEDEELVRQLVCRTLESAGYRVLTAAGPQEALEIADTHDGGLDLLVSDVIMPGMKGPELARRLRETHAELEVLFVSGYGGDDFSDFELPPGTRFLSKPVTPARLTAEVREALDRPTSTD